MYDAETIIRDCAEMLRLYMRRLMKATFTDESPIKHLPLDALEDQDSALNTSIRLLVKVANSDVPGDMADMLLMQDVEDAIALVRRTLFMPPGTPRMADIPPDFWDDDLGNIIRLCQIWLLGDDLITYTEAAELLWPEEDVQTARMRVKRMVKRGMLTGYIDPTVSNPQHAARVSRQEVEAFR